MIARISLSFLLLIGLSLLLTGCSFDWEPGSQGVGQECGADADCMDSLVCRDRRCRAVLDGELPPSQRPDAGADVDDPPPVLNHSNDRPNDEQPPPVLNDESNDIDPPPPRNDVANHTDPCVQGETQCINPQQLEVCAVGADGQLEWMTRTCPEDQSCSGGACEPHCGPDEVYNPITGECVPDDQPPPPVCCPNGCADDEICTGCACEPFDPATCQFQNQPCQFDGQISGGYICTRLGDVDDLRCYGLCNTNAADPDQTCPQSGSICAFSEPGNPNGFCMESCQIGDNCGDSGISCRYYDAGSSDGLCFPSTGSGGVGQPCDNFDTFSCSGSALCIEGTCLQSCRPFDQPTTDCPAGHCLPFGSSLGICPGADTPVADDGTCQQEFLTCGEDATGCFPSETQPGQLECMNYCRLDQGDADCPGEQFCTFSGFGEEDLGICSSTGFMP